MAKRATKRPTKRATAAGAKPAARGTRARAAAASAGRKAKAAPSAAKPKGKSGHGGRREGAGRKPMLDSKGRRIHPPHDARPKWTGRRVVLIEAPLAADVPDLSKGKYGKILQAIFAGGFELEGFRLLAYGVERTRLRYVIQVDSPRALATGMKSIGSSISLTINPIRKAHGRLYSTRYQLTILEPSAVKKAVAEVGRHAL